MTRATLTSDELLGARRRTPAGSPPRTRALESAEVVGVPVRDGPRARSRSSRSGSPPGRTSTTSSRSGEDDEPVDAFERPGGRGAAGRRSPECRPTGPACGRSASSSRTAPSCSTSCTCSSSTAGSRPARTRSSRCSAPSVRARFANAPEARGRARDAGAAARDRAGLGHGARPVASAAAGSSRSTRSRDDPSWLPDRAWRLGEVTAELHGALAAIDADPAFAPEEPSAESLGLLAAAIDEEIATTFADAARGRRARRGRPSRRGPARPRPGDGRARGRPGSRSGRTATTTSARCSGRPTGTGS